MRGKQAAPLVRVAANQAYQICFALDAGARGIVVPMVNTSAEAEAAVRACRYFPSATAATPGCAASGASSELPRLPRYRERRLVIVRTIETNQSLENLDAIASVPGVDVLLIGPSDLSIELGEPLDYSCDTYQRTLDKIAAAAAKRGIAAGMYFIPPEMDPNFFVQKGFKFFTMPWGPWQRPGSRTAYPGSSANDGRRGRWANGQIAQRAPLRGDRHSRPPRQIILKDLRQHLRMITPLGAKARFRPGVASRQRPGARVPKCSSLPSY